MAEDPGRSRLPLIALRLDAVRQQVRGGAVVEVERVGGGRHQVVEVLGRDQRDGEVDRLPGLEHREGPARDQRDPVALQFFGHRGPLSGEGGVAIGIDDRGSALGGDAPVEEHRGPEGHLPRGASPGPSVGEGERIRGVVERHHCHDRKAGAHHAIHHHRDLPPDRVDADATTRYPVDRDHRGPAADRARRDLAPDPVVDVPQPVLARPGVEVGQQAHVDPAQRRGAVIGDVELQPRDPVVARRAPGVRLLVHRQPQRLVVLPARIHRVHRLRPVVHVVRRQHLVRREPQVLVDLRVPVVVLPVQHLLVDAPVAVVVDQPTRPRIAAPRHAHPIVLGEGRAPLEERPARDMRPPRDGGQWPALVMRITKLPALRQGPRSSMSSTAPAGAAETRSTASAAGRWKGARRRGGSPGKEVRSARGNGRRTDFRRRGCEAQRPRRGVARAQRAAARPVMVRPRVRSSVAAGSVSCTIRPSYITRIRSLSAKISESSAETSSTARP